MEVLHFDTAAVPPADRLSLFRRGAVHFQVDAVGAPHAFGARWRLLRLGDVNAIHSTISGVRYRRDRALIDADGEDRIAIHVRVSGDADGEIDGEAVRVGVGDASVWDLSRPLDMGSADGSEVLILTLPRYMVQEVMPGVTLGPAVRRGPALATAADQLLYLLDHADDLPEAGAVYYGRALRDMFAVALLPACRSPSPSAGADASLLVRICERIDRDPKASESAATLAAALGTPLRAIDQAVATAGGLAALVERRRLLAAYRLLLDPVEAATVSSIARHCGFSDMPRFSRRFRDVFHTSARDLRRYRRGFLPDWAGAYHVDRNYSDLKVG